MKNYGKFLVIGGLCLAGCSSSGNTPTQASGVSSSAGSPASPASTMPAATSGSAANAGTRAPAMQSSAANGGSGASSPTTTPSAGSSAAADRPASAGAPGAAGGTSSSSSGAGASAMGSAGSSSAAGSGGGSMDPTFTNVYSMVLMSMQCPQCHKQGGVFGSPDFSSKDNAYKSLVGMDASTMNPPGACSGMGKLVVPGDCDMSLLYNKISQDTPKCGRRMPLSSTTVTKAGIDLVCAWIKAGAKQD